MSCQSLFQEKVCFRVFSYTKIFISKYTNLFGNICYL